LRAGNSSSYRVLKPGADIIVYLFMNEKINDEEARRFIATLNEIADYNIENNETYAQYYEYEKALMMQEINKIDEMIYDCTYFVNKLKPIYEDNPREVDNLKYIIATLKKQGCEESEPFLMKVEEEYEVYAKKYNDSLQAVFEANNPSIVAKKCYDEGDYDCAVEKYQEAIDKEEDKDTKAQYYFAMASIQGRKLNQYSTARVNALKAAELRKAWGRPYMLIGDLYAQSSRSCGNDAYTRGLAVIAAIDKWAYAKTVDQTVADEANRNIAKFSQYLPPQDDAFMMGKKEGETEKVGCWIGENVKLRFN
jgi:tetratricopeptide (TPR) repeat protein